MKRFIYISLLAFVILPLGYIYSQSVQKKWSAVEISYQEQDKSFEEKKEDSSFYLIDGIQLIYKSLVSDVDGDNCPFKPSCSSFFVQSVKTTNIFQGILMTADRLTRDLNLIKNHYLLSKDGHFIDPPGNYTLNKNQIYLIPILNK